MIVEYFTCALVIQLYIDMFRLLHLVVRCHGVLDKASLTVLGARSRISM